MGPSRDPVRDTLVFSSTEPSTDDLSTPPFPPDWERYEVVGYLGAGGMGHVFRAIDRTLRRPVALKFLRPGVAGAAARFLREARAQAAIEHENVCRVYEVGEVGGQPYIAMQLVEGVPLDQATDGLPRERIVALVEIAALALHAAHRTGLIHRDVKPANILVARGADSQLVPVLVDFGLARELGAEGSTLTTSISGTPAYMAPEQARGVPVDRRADVYALGAVLYELLAGEPPVKALHLAQALREVVEGSPAPLRKRDPTIPRDLDTIVATCLEKDPGRRYASARAFADDLRRFLEGEPIAARRVSVVERALRWLDRRRVIAASAAAVLVAIALGLGIAARARIEAGHAADAARFFAAELARLETEARLASMVPSGEPGALRARLDAAATRLDHEISRRGPTARAPGLAALGRLALLRGDLDAARDHLELAVRLDPSPLVRSDLGLALARAWSEALIDLPVIADSGLAAAERVRLERELRDPALALLGDSAPEGEGRLVQAQLALCAGRFDEAALIAREAAQAEPWRFDARRLTAEIEIEAATAELQRGDSAAASRRLESARAELTQALSIARGDLESWLVGCRLEQLATTVMARTAAVAEEQLARMVENCEVAYHVDPDSTAARRGLVGALSAAADTALRSGHELLGWIDRGLAVSADAPARADAGLWRARGRLLATAADRAARRGEDPLAILAEAATSLEQARRLAPTSPDIVNGLGTVHYRAAAWSARAGADTRPSLERAIAALEAATELAPRSAAARTNLGSALVALAEARRIHGEDPLGPLAQAIDAFDAAVAVDPERPAFHNNRGNAFLTRAEILHESGADPRAALAEAMASYRQALVLRPRYATASHNLAWAARLGAEAALVRCEESVTELETARGAIRAALEIDPGDASSHALLARIETLAVVAGDRRALSAAEKAIARGRAIDPTLADLELAAAEVELVAGRATGDVDARDRALERLRFAVASKPELRAMREPRC